ncbi:hypothetical protein CANCADRAFT_61886 [Tortispora caseinolytica NRRL Y-17796]|uniref:Cytochrome c oxidase assembly protein COX15 n=1 Tax=Tortispora caseinolytica NRRL Y-17796 TaxID=767744 RepID=A0A1E4TAI9_9ASCO|nr:hypothetical protein CANCADRAFT_61886 [Tortispora caseinolytica NRRL Y-17796]
MIMRRFANLLRTPLKRSFVNSSRPKFECFNNKILIYKRWSSSLSVKPDLPKMTSNSVGYWLLGSSGLVFGIVVLGGLTRLTESGLSITEWKPVTGSIPPTTTEQWEEEFEKYKQSPEFHMLNSNMNLSDFKKIYFMEWIHREYGRALGLIFVVPALYFVFKKRVSPVIGRRLLLLSGLFALQGGIGWWMVKSGLDDDIRTTPGAYPRVSHYRLATHLAAAFALYIAMFSTGLNIIRENRMVKNPAASLDLINALNSKSMAKFRTASWLVFGLVFLTAMSGAFVAGLDAGLIYNEFPYMGESIVPPKEELFKDYYSKAADKSDFIWRNLFENPTTVQFNHRVLATASFCAVTALHIFSIRLKRKGPQFMPPTVFKAGAAAMGFASLQVTLGFFTLLYLVPIPLASAHQAGSLALLTSLLVLCMRQKRPSPLLKRFLQYAATNASKASNTAKVTSV